MGGQEFDVVVAGCGVASLSAAASAVESGVRVAVLECATRDERGGQSRYAEAYLRMKTHSEVTDDFETHLAENGAGYVDPDLIEDAARPREEWSALVKPLSIADPDLIENFAAAAGPMVAWMQSLGARVEFLPTQFLTRSQPRLLPVGGGAAIVDALAVRAEQLGGDVFLSDNRRWPSDGYRWLGVRLARRAQRQSSHRSKRPGCSGLRRLPLKDHSVRIQPLMPISNSFSDRQGAQWVPGQASGLASDSVVALDVASKTAVDELVGNVEREFGPIGILVNAAGVVSFGQAQSLDEAEWDRVMNINLKGSFFTCQSVMGSMRRQGSGRIVNIGSVVGKNGGNARPWLDPAEQQAAGSVVYGVSKAGIHTMTAFLAKELAASGVTVNAVAPGPISTAMTTGFPAALQALIPVGRMGTLNDVTRAILFLAEGDAGFISGEVLDINGGMWCD